MKNKKRKLLATLMTLAMVFSLFAAMPITASATSGANLIDLSDFDASGDWQGGASNTGWTYTDELSTEDMHKFTITDAVSVTGSATMLSEIGIWLEFSGGTVTWSADLHGNADDVCLLYINNPNGSFVMTGGVVSNSGGNAGIQISGSNRDITLSGGMVSATSGYGIQDGGTVTLSGGTVTSAGTAIDAEIIEATTDTTTVNGAVEVADYIWAYDGGELIINGDVSMSEDDAWIWAGISAAGEDPGIIRITDNVTFDGNSSYFGAHDGGVVNIAGNVQFNDDNGSISANGTEDSVSDIGTVNIGGNVTFDGNESVAEAYNGGKLTIKGDVTFDGDNSGIWAHEDGLLDITGKLSLKGTDNYIKADNWGGVLTVDGDVAFTNADTSGCYIRVSNGSTIYFLDSVTTGIKVEILDASTTILNTTVGTPTRTNATLSSPYNGYYWHEYTAIPSANDQSYLFIRQGAIPPPSPPSGGGGSSVTTYTVSFNTNGGSSVASSRVNANGKLTKPADPTREGYDFAGWYTDAALTIPYDFNANVTKGLTLYAKWTEKAKEIFSDG